MNQDKAVVKAMLSFEEETDFKLTYNQLKCVRKYFYMLYGIGYDRGRQQESHWKVILQMKEGAILDRFDSVEEAAKMTKIDRGNISKAAQGHIKTAGGYDWRFKGQITKWKYKRKLKINSL